MSTGQVNLGSFTQTRERATFETGSVGLGLGRDTFVAQPPDGGLASQQSEASALASAARHSPRPLGFGDYSPADRTELKSIAKGLAHLGQLFIQPGPSQPLQKVDAAALFASLEEGQGGLVYVVQRGQEQKEGHSSSSSSQNFGGYAVGALGETWNNMVDANSKSGSATAGYSATPLFSWQELLWADTEGRGLPEVDTLAAPHGTARVQEWHACHEHGSRSASHGDGFGDSGESSSYDLSDWKN